MEQKNTRVIIPLIIGISIFAGFYLARFVGVSPQKYSKQTDKLAALMELIETEYVISVSRS
jgi:nitrogen regulatory protein PII-like uncharacterized protein